MREMAMKLSVCLMTIIMLSFGQYAKAAEGLTDEQIVERARGNISADMWAIQPDETATDRDFQLLLSGKTPKSIKTLPEAL